MAAKDAELSDALKRYTLYSMQKYRTHYLLAKLSQYVDMAYKGLKIPGSLGDYQASQVEHILPDTPERSLLDDFTARNPNAIYNDCKIRLGNLTLLEKPINIVASNDFFRNKTVEYAKCKHYLTSSIAGLTPVGINSSISRINEKLRSFDDWTADTIEQRQTMLINLVKGVWKITPIEVS
jgi:hypothetical protein